MPPDDEVKRLAQEEERLKELWQKILIYIKRDIAYVYTDIVRRELSEIKEEVKRIEDFLKTLRYRAYTNDKKRFEIEIEHLELLLKYIENLDKTKPNDFIRQVHTELMQVISDLEREKAEGRNVHVWERKKLLEEWGFQLGVHINLEKRLIGEWESTSKIKEATEPNFVRAIFTVGLPRCRDLVERDGLLKTGIDLIKIAEKSKLGENALTLFSSGLPRDEEVIKIKNLLSYGLDLIKKIKILYPIFLDGKDSIDEYQFKAVVSLAQATESVQKAKLYVELSKQWDDKFLVNITDEQTIRRRRGDFHYLITNLSGYNITPRPIIRSVKETRELMIAFMEFFEFIYSLPDEIKNESEFGQFREGAIRIGLDNHSPTDARTLLYFYKTYVSTVEKRVLYRFLDVVGIYGRHHGLSKGTVKQFQEKLLPAMVRGSQNVNILQRAGNIWGMRRGDFGMADFIMHCYAVKINPPNLNNLILIAKEVPTTDSDRLEQNRKDALTLASPFGILRDFIHDQRPLVYGVLIAMVEYYDTNNKINLESVLNRVEGYVGYPDNKKLLFDRTRYERDVEETVNGEKRSTKAINVVRRLAANTAPITQELSVTSDEELNRKMSKIKDYATERDLQETLEYVNEKLVKMMKRGEIGIESSLILALGWIERKAFGLLQKLKYEEQMSAYKKKWFHAILKFQELTNSPNNFDEKEFEAFLKKVASIDSDLEAYKFIGKRVLENIAALAKIYKVANRGHITGALWSGNVTHELIGLTDFKPATTRYGEKRRAEKLVPPWMRKTGD